jgi:3-(3-hydroxy-phenyl)propionate hydroxylase
MTAALALRAQGLPVTVVEAGAQDRVRPGSRAIFIHRSMMELLERIHPGLGWEVNAHGLLWQTKRTLYRGRQVYEKTYPPADPSVLPAATSLPQMTIEQLLYPACLSAGVSFVWSSPVTGVETSPAESSCGRRTARRSRLLYVIAATVRAPTSAFARHPLEGPRAENAFVIVDAAEDPADPMPLERVFTTSTRRLAVQRAPRPLRGHWRIDLQCFPDDDPDRFSGPKASRAGFRWWSTPSTRRG